MQETGTKQSTALPTIIGSAVKVGDHPFTGSLFQHPICEVSTRHRLSLYIQSYLHVPAIQYRGWHGTVNHFTSHKQRIIPPLWTLGSGSPHQTTLPHSLAPTWSEGRLDNVSASHATIPNSLVYCPLPWVTGHVEGAWSTASARPVATPERWEGFAKAYCKHSSQG